MEKLRRLARRITTDPEKKVLDYVVDLAVEFTGAERGLLIRGQGDRLHVASARNVDQESLRGREARLSLTIARECIERQETLLVDDAASQQLFSEAESVYELGLRSVLCVPVRAGAQTVAALSVDSRFLPGAFGAQDAQFLETLAEFLSILLWREEREGEREEYSFFGFDQ